MKASSKAFAAPKAKVAFKAVSAKPYPKPKVSQSEGRAQEHIQLINDKSMSSGLPPPFRASASSSDERSKASPKGEEEAEEEQEEEEEEEGGENPLNKSKGRKKDDEDDEGAGGVKGAKKRPAARKGGGGANFEKTSLSRLRLGVAKKPAAKRTIEKKKGPKRTKKNESGEAQHLVVLARGQIFGFAVDLIDR